MMGLRMPGAIAKRVSGWPCTERSAGPILHTDGEDHA